MARRRVLTMNNDNLAGPLFLLPFALLFLVFRVYPVLEGLRISLYRRDILGMENAFVGAGNYLTLLQDEAFWQALWNTARYTLLSTPTMVPGALILALAVGRPMTGGRAFRMIFFTPRVLSVAVATLIWRWVYQPEWGLLNHYFERLGIPGQNWLSSPVWSMFAIVVTDVWWKVGLPMLIFAAGLSQIDPQLYEAARVDGAGSWQGFWHITLPGLRPSLLFVLATHLIGSLQIFGLIFIMTGGGPYHSTRVLVQYIYENGFQYFKMGYASALAYALMVFMLILTLLQFRVLSPKE